MAHNSEAQLTSILEIPIVDCRTGPFKRLVADLHEVAHMLDRSRNAMVRAWRRWREDHEDWIPPQAVGKDGKPRFTKKGEPCYVNPMHPNRVTEDGKPCGADDGTGFDTWLYHHGRAVSPFASAGLMSMVRGEVSTNLQTDVSHHHKGHKYRWQAILAHDEQPPTFRARTIPVPNNAALLCYAGKTAGKGGNREMVEFHGGSHCVLSFPLFAKESGRRITCPIVTLNVGALSPGNREVVAKVARGEWGFSDSKLVFKAGGGQKKEKWVFQLTYKRPSQSLGLNPKRTATLWAMLPNQERPFLIESPDVIPEGKNAGRNVFWGIGNGRNLAVAFQRIETRRKRLRNRYKTATSAHKGHGRSHVEFKLRPWSHGTKNLQRHFVWQMVAEVVKFCQRNDCGSVVYREPVIPAREKLWLAANGAPFDWTTLSTDLAHKLRQYGISLEVSKVGLIDIRERFGGEGEGDGAAKKTPSPKPVAPKVVNGAARMTEGDAGQGNGRGKDAQRNESERWKGSRSRKAM